MLPMLKTDVLADMQHLLLLPDL